MEKPTQKFTGVFIPAHIWNDSTLTWLEKCLLGEIDALSDVQRGCYASNDYLAKMMGSSQSSIANMISKLRKRKLIRDVTFDGRNREIRTDYTAGGITPELKQDAPESESRVHPQVKARVHPQVNLDNREEEPKKEPAPPAGNLEEGGKFADFFKTLLPHDFKLAAKWRENWAKEYDAMIRLDGRTKEQIVAVCRWARKDTFWQGAFFSPAKLREKKHGIMYFDQFSERMKRPVVPGTTPAERKEQTGSGEYAMTGGVKTWTPPEE